MRSHAVLSVGALIAIGIGIYVAVAGVGAHAPQPQACTTEAKICPDGSAVGRTGPNCEFAACPEATSTIPATAPVVGLGEHCGGFIRNAPVCAAGSHCLLAISHPDTGGTCVADDASGGTPATSATVDAKIGQKVSGVGISLTPLEIISDSRCPTDVQCIWAGTVQLKTQVESASGKSEMTLELGKPITVGAADVTLTLVGPAKSSKTEIPAGLYRFTFEIKKK